MSMSSLERYAKQNALRSRDQDEERWHVKLSPDDMKLMTVEQLDDAYRLSLVDSDTEVWTVGMPRWKRLGSVAGLDADGAATDADPEVTKVGPSPHDATPRAPLRAVPTPRAPAPPPSRSIPPPPKLMVVAKPAAPPGSPQFGPRGAPPAVSAPPPVHAPSPAPRISSSVVSVAPVAQSIAPPLPAPARSGGFGRFLLVVALFAGVVLSLYRNDVLLDWARKLHVEARFLRFEQRYLGGPSFGTLRAVPRAVGAKSVEAVAHPALSPPAKSAEEPAPTIAAARLSDLPLVAESPPAAPLALQQKTSEAAAHPVEARAKAPSSSALPGRATVTQNAVRRQAPKGKRAPQASEYDPLNPAL